MSNITIEHSTSTGLDQHSLDKIINLIGTAKNGVCGIVAPTGSGKSTTLIETIINIHRKSMEQIDENKRVKIRIFVTEPTIPAVQSLYKRMVQNLSKQAVGWAAGGEVNYTDENELVYCTAGHMRNY